MNHEQSTPQIEKNKLTIDYLNNTLSSSGVFKNDVLSIGLDRVVPLVDRHTGEEGIESSLIGVIKAGDELFGLVAVRQDGDNKKVSFAVSQFNEGSNGKFVGAVSKAKPSLDNFGRAKWHDALDATVSRNHFSVELNDRQEIVVTDNGSSNGTQLFAKFKTDSNADEPLPEGPLHTSAWVPDTSDVKIYT